MTTPEKALQIANGNRDAALFLVTYAAFCHLLDDIHDKDVTVNDHTLAKTSLQLIEVLLLNPFVQANRVALWPVIAVGFNAWIDANRWEDSPDEWRRRDADVVKSIYQEVLWLTANLCGGFDHMRAMSSAHREYNHDFKG